METAVDPPATAGAELKVADGLQKVECLLQVQSSRECGPLTIACLKAAGEVVGGTKLSQMFSRRRCRHPLECCVNGEMAGWVEARRIKRCRKKLAEEVPSVALVRCGGAGEAPVCSGGAGEALVNRFRFRLAAVGNDS